MASGRYDITAEQGVTFKFHIRYRDSRKRLVDLDPDLGWTARMQVRRSAEDSDLLLNITTSGVTGGGSTGEFTSGSGVAGSGGITLNASSTGGTGHSGGILLGVDANTMSSVPKGNHFYDLELVLNNNTVVRLIEGRFTTDREITR